MREGFAIKPSTLPVPVELLRAGLHTQAGPKRLIALLQKRGHRRLREPAPRQLGRQPLTRFVDGGVTCKAQGPRHVAKPRVELGVHFREQVTAQDALAAQLLVEAAEELAGVAATAQLFLDKDAGDAVD